MCMISFSLNVMTRSSCGPGKELVRPFRISENAWIHHARGEAAEPFEFREG